VTELWGVTLAPVEVRELRKKWEYCHVARCDTVMPFEVGQKCTEVVDYKFKYDDAVRLEGPSLLWSLVVILHQTDTGHPVLLIL
jgi:hypothetical protein